VGCAVTGIELAKAHIDAQKRCDQRERRAHALYERLERLIALATEAALHVGNAKAALADSHPDHAHVDKAERELSEADAAFDRWEALLRGVEPASRATLN
jgi:hypothetical protein